MNFKELINSICTKYEINNFHIAECSPKIRDVRFIDDIVNWKNDVVYVGDYSKIASPPDTPIMLISLTQPKTLPEGSSYCTIKKDDLIKIFNLVKDLIYEDLHAEVALLELAQAALDGKNILLIMNMAANIMGNALILVDTNMRIIAHSTNFEIMDPLWKENIERGRYSYDFMRKVRKSKDMTEWMKSGKEAKIITLSGDIQPKLVARITKDGHLLGALVMIAHHRPIEDFHFRQLPLIGKLLMDSFNHELSEGIHKPIHSSILYSLLDEVQISDVIELINISNASFPKIMQVVVAQFVTPIQNRYLKNTISVELEGIFPSGFPVQYKGYITRLVEAITSAEREKLERLVADEEISIGISWPFENILEFKRYFNQAVASIKQARRFNMEKGIFDYTHFSYYDLLYNYTGKLPLKHYCHPSLKTLKEYDEGNNTDFYITLKTYLECNKNIAATAKELYIHRNSLLYRINRIIEITGLDLNDNQVCNALLDSFRINNFLNSMPVLKK